MIDRIMLAALCLFLGGMLGELFVTSTREWLRSGDAFMRDSALLFGVAIALLCLMTYGAGLTR